jgi:hypothetical protein
MQNAEIPQLNRDRADPRRRLAAEFAHHPLIAGRLFYTLPAGLLFHLRTRRLALHRLDPGLYRLERVTTYLVSKQRGTVGAWDCEPVRYRFLAPPPPASSLKRFVLGAFRNDPGWQSILARLDQNLAAVDSRMGGLHENTLGYCGWLMTNARFVEEHDCFFARWREMVRTYGLPRRGPLPAGIERWFDTLAAPPADAATYAAEYGALLDRWELADLRAPYLPEPREVQFPVLLPHQANHLARGGGTLLYLPSNAAVPDRDAARDMIAASLNAQAAPAHLEEWHQIVHAKNKAKNRIPRFARVFRLQHYWAVLHRRWGERRLKRKTEKLQLAFAAYLMPDEVEPEQGFDTVRKDLRLIARSRGGPGWYRKPNTLDLF